MRHQAAPTLIRETLFRKTPIRDYLLREPLIRKLFFGKLLFEKLQFAKLQCEQLSFQSPIFVHKFTMFAYHDDHDSLRDGDDDDDVHAFHLRAHTPPDDAGDLLQRLQERGNTEF